MCHLKNNVNDKKKIRLEIFDIKRNELIGIDLFLTMSDRLRALVPLRNTPQQPLEVV
jgi:hypothetical protein